MRRPKLNSRFMMAVIFCFLSLFSMLTGAFLIFFAKASELYAAEVLQAKAVILADQVFEELDSVKPDLASSMTKSGSYFTKTLSNLLSVDHVAGITDPATHSIKLVSKEEQRWSTGKVHQREILPLWPLISTKPQWRSGERQNLITRFPWPARKWMITRIEPVFHKDRFVANIVMAYPVRQLFYRSFRGLVSDLCILFATVFLICLLFLGLRNRRLSRNIEQLYLSFEEPSAALIQEPASFVYEEFWQVVQWNRAVAGQLQESVVLQATLFQNSPCGISIINNDGEVVETNSAAWELLNRLDNSSKHWKITEIAPDFVEVLERVRAGKNHTGEATLVNGQDEIVILFSAAPIQTESWQGAVMFWLDQTEVKRLGTRLWQTERYQLVGELASIAAHELRNPLTTIVANAQLGQMVTEQPKAKDLFKRIQQASLRMSDFLSEMMNMCRPVTEELVPLEVKTILSEVLSMVKAQLLTQGIELDFRIEENLPRIWAEGKLLRQVFLNITQNAIQAMPTGGRLTVSAHAAANEVVISFQDTGDGIPAEVQGQLFNRFVTSKENGNGLGLFITRQIMVQTFAGRIWWSSHPGEGAEFFLAFPISGPTSQTLEDSLGAYWRPRQSMVQ